MKLYSSYIHTQQSSGEEQQVNKEADNQRPEADNQRPEADTADKGFVISLRFDIPAKLFGYKLGRIVGDKPQSRPWSRFCHLG
jgi:hypothetical protein